MIPHTRVYLKQVKSYERVRCLTIGSGSNHHQLKRNSLLSSIIPHTRLYLRLVRFYERGVHRGWAKSSPMNKEVSAEFNDISQKGLHEMVL